MTTKITEKNISNISNAAVQWQTVVTADGSTATTAVAGYGYFIDTTSAAHTVNLPNTANVGDTIILKDYTGTWGTNNVTISSTLKISGADADGTLSTNNTTVTIVYMDTTKGWTPIQNSTQSALAADPAYISATGGTITTSGDYKIHTFTGDGCFVVSCGGNPGGSTQVDYLVVAGGGAGGDAGNRGGGGGGAGGYRESHSTPVSGCYTASPLATPTGITITATTYPITVGGGGAGVICNSTNANPGSNSVFSTITASGGGGGGACCGSSPLGRDGAPGGSGGGGGGSGCVGSGGTGNTPPTSPPQGNNGGAHSPGTNTCSAGGGGGGAIATGTAGITAGGAGPGGAGAGTLINPVTGESGPSCLQYYSGGGGGASANGGGPNGQGGIGGGGVGEAFPCAAQVTPGDANTGGGGGASSNNQGGGNGGKGIVILRYKFQN